jgi:hypothetical protein
MMILVFHKKIISLLVRPILRKGLFGFSKNLFGFFFVLLGIPTVLQAYIPGESFVSLTDDQGLFSNQQGYLLLILKEGYSPMNIVRKKFINYN